jgi:hypothetical protein
VCRREGKSGNRLWENGRGRCGQGGEMTQALYAHMNNKRKKMQKKIFDLFGIDFLNRVKDRALVLGFCM